MPKPSNLSKLIQFEKKAYKNYGHKPDKIKRSDDAQKFVAEGVDSTARAKHRYGRPNQNNSSKLKHNHYT